MKNFIRNLGALCAIIGSTYSPEVHAVLENVKDRVAGVAADLGEKAAGQVAHDAGEKLAGAGAENAARAVGFMSYFGKTLKSYLPESLVHYLNEHPDVQTGLVIAGGVGASLLVYSYWDVICARTQQVARLVYKHKGKIAIAAIVAWVIYGYNNGYFTEQAKAEGEDMARTLAENTKNAAYKAENKAEEIVGDAQEVAEQAWEKTKDTAADVAGKAKGTAIKAKDALLDTAGKVKDKAGEVASNVAGAVKGTAQGAKDALVGGAEQAKDTAKGVSQSVKGKASELAVKTKDVVEGAKEGAKNAAVAKTPKHVLVLTDEQVNALQEVGKKADNA